MLHPNQDPHLARSVGILLLAFAAFTACETATTRHARAELVWQALETPTCDLPCWHSITPGESTRADVEAILAASEFVAGHECIDLPDSDEQGRSGGFCYWESRAESQLWGGVFSFAREGQEPLAQNMLYLRYPISFEEVVAHFGEPDAVWANRYETTSEACRCSSSNPRQADDDGPDFELIYPALGLIFAAQAEQPDQWPCLCPLMWVDAIMLQQPGDPDDLGAWWHLNFGHGLDEAGGLFFDFPGWETPFE